MQHIDPERGNPEPSPVLRRTGKSRPLRFAGYLLLALAGLAAGFLIYIIILFGQPLRTRIAIVDIFETISLDAVQLDDEDDAGAVPWEHGGRTRVYVHPSFPIRQVEQKDPDIENILVFGVDSRSAANIVSR